MYQQFLEHIILPIGDFINNSSFCKDLLFWRKVDTLNSEELEKLQQDNLRKILKHTSLNVRYYNYIKLIGNNPNDWLQEFPILTKDILRNQSENLLAVKNKRLKKISSSGSSGISSSVYMNTTDLSTLRAGLVHWWEWYGYFIGRPIIQTGISPKRGLLKSLKDYFFKTIYINAFSHSEEQIVKILKRLKRDNQYILAGYASSLNVIADIAEKYHFKIKFKSVISFGDKMFSHYRKNIEKVFDCRVYDTYGSAEGFLIGAEYDLEYMYILSPQTYIEILDDNNRPVPDGAIGNIVVTRLDGYAMPLIRYKIGDLGVLLPKKEYPKERKFQYPLLQKVIGRDTDIVKTRNGKILVVHSFTGIFGYVSEIKQFKIIQKNLDGITIEYIKSDGFKKSLLIGITRKIQFYIEDETFIITFKEVKFIAPTKSGKPQIIESLIKK
jgi:phenylacetate-CoA ligase